jgi:hypothetical protein
MSAPKARPKEFKRNEEVQVCDANGSIEIIYRWANAAGTDARQKRSFKSMVV